MIEEQMNAVRMHALGDPGRLEYERIPTPRPGAGEVLVRVHAAAITRDELEWPQDRLPATPSYEFSGVVAAIGADVGEVDVGESVYALSGFDRDGAAAEYTVVPEEVLAPKPRTLDHAESAAIPLAGLSAWQGLFDHGKLRPGQRVLIHGAAGGVGQFATQLAHLRSAHVIGTATGDGVEDARTLGADEVVDTAAARFEDAIERVDLVFDTVGGDRLARSPDVVRPGGRLVSIAEDPPDAPGREVRTTYFVVEPNRGQLLEIARLVENGELRVMIDSVFSLRDARRAFARTMEALSARSSCVYARRTPANERFGPSSRCFRRRRFGGACLFI
jgi:NADPH:quinone reductase-like Zn-dependent oxidoreductase